MFVKHHRVKSNTRIRGSERKELRAKVERSFNHYDFEEPLTSIISNKDEINVLKTFTNKKEVAQIYMINKNPMFFEWNKVLCPSMYFLWSNPKLVPSVATSPVVITKLANGADLMLPGILVPSSTEAIPKFAKDAIVSINTEDNFSSLAVGIALMSSDDIFFSQERQGRAVQVLHVFGDHLWQEGEQTQPPKLENMNNQNKSAPTVVKSSATDKEASTAVEEKSGGEKSLTVESLSIVDSGDVETQEGVVQAGWENDEVDPVPNSANGDSLPCEQSDQAEAEGDECTEDDMDELLHNCFMTALKVKLKDKELPIATGTFYRSKVLLCCPSGKFLDIKKTKYKKLSKYLKSMEDRGLIKMKEVSKGVDHIVSVNRAHDDLKSFVPLPSEPTESSEEANTESQFGVVTQKRYEPPVIALLYGVNALTEPLFRAAGCKKGTVIDATQVRQLVTEYVRVNDLVKDQFVTLDPVLHDALFKKEGVDVERVKWDTLFAKLFAAMQIHHQLQFKGTRPIVKKGHPPKITVKLEQRTGNKKVTLVHNLESFLIRPQQFADAMKKKAQASTSVTVMPGSKPNNPVHQVLIQGNQVRSVEEILTGEDSYQLPRKYVEGLQLAPKSKKKRN